VPPLPGSTRFRLLPLSPAQRHRYLADALGEESARGLDLRLSRDPALDNLTRTPFILAEVATLFRSGAPIPNAKLGLIRAVVEFTANMEEHRSHLQAPPLRGLGLFFARSDPSLAVRLAALHGLSWMGQYDAVAETLQSLPDSEFEQAIAKFHREGIPLALYPRTIARTRRSWIAPTTARPVFKSHLL
jgi:hypothetical protein